MGAVEFIDNSYHVIVLYEDANAYSVYKKGNEIKREVIIKDTNFRNQGELLW